MSGQGKGLEFKLVESMNESKDFNTIDLDKIIIDNTQDTTLNVRLPEDIEIGTTTSEKINSSNKSSQINESIQVVEEKKLYNTLKEPIVDTLVHIFIIFT